MSSVKSFVDTYLNGFWYKLIEDADSKHFSDNTYFVRDRDSIRNSCVALTISDGDRGQTRYTITFCDDKHRPASGDRMWPKGTVSTHEPKMAAAFIKAATAM